MLNVYFVVAIFDLVSDVQAIHQEFVSNLIRNTVLWFYETLRSNIIECLSMGRMYPILEANKSPIPWTISPSGDDMII